MKSILVCGKTLPEAYHKALLALDEHGVIIPCPDYETERKDITMTLFIEEALCEPMISRMFIGDPYSLEQYKQEMLYGILDFEVARGNWEYTYHQRMEKQIPWVIEELRRNPHTSRAVIVIRSESDQSTTSPACLQHIQYFIRDGKLDCKILFRSNDAAEATFMNAFALIMLQKDIADKLGLKVGSYEHRANSFHAYAKDFDMLNGYVNRIQTGGDLTFDYVGDWDKQMDEEKLRIAAMVKEHKERE